MNRLLRFARFETAMGVHDVQKPSWLRVPYIRMAWNVFMRRRRCAAVVVYHVISARATALT
ncbi:hypothetical protein WI79_16965 [Burkholderia ubonensis]|nr:hypothetical protein WI79_16965 [Burkholderia ubonensis]